MVTDLETGKSIESEYRTSSGTFLNKAQVHELYIPLFYAAISFSTILLVLKLLLIFIKG